MNTLREQFEKATNTDLEATGVFDHDYVHWLESKLSHPLEVTDDELFTERDKRITLDWNQEYYAGFATGFIRGGEWMRNKLSPKQSGNSAK